MINNIKENTKNAILNGGAIDEIVLSPKRTVGIKFNDKHRSISPNITPYYLGKCVQDYLKLRTEKQGELQDKQIVVTKEGLTEIQFKKYKNRVVEAFYNLFCAKLSNNYAHKNKN